jgi:glycosyltransferase involved in cell wall biosynthesis
VNALLVLAALPAFFGALYLFVLTLCARQPTRPPTHGPPTLRFDLVVPAHDEAAGVAQTVSSLLAVDYPPGLRRVVVIADNCTDATAERARAAGALVLERVDPTRTGKGRALATAFAWCLGDGFADAVVVVDADTLVSPNLLTAFDARLVAGARALQAEYGVRNPERSWRTRLMRIALAAFHQVRSLGRARLGVSCGLRGNGMAFRTEVLREVPTEAFSLVEDLEYGVRLGRAGVRVDYVPEARVLGEMVSSEKASRSQRLRWEAGRAALRHTEGWPLLRDAFARRDALLFDLALDLLLPPLAQLGGVIALGLALSVTLRATVGLGAPAVVVLLLAAAMLGAHVLAGWRASGTGVRGLADLALAPAYLAWKLTLPLRTRPSSWVRTERERSARP